MNAVVPGGEAIDQIELLQVIVGRSSGKQEKTTVFLGRGSLQQEEKRLQDCIIEPAPNRREVDQSFEVIEQHTGRSGPVCIFKNFGNIANLLALSHAD